MEGVIIAIVSILAFLALGGFVLYKILSGPDLPNGYKFTKKMFNNEAFVFFSKGMKRKNKKTFIVGGQEISAEEITKKCCIAIHSTEEAFKQKGVGAAQVEDVVFLFQTDEEFEEGNEWWKSWSKNVAAYSKIEKGFLGLSEIAWVVIREKHLPGVRDKGQPAIHELVHILNEVAGRGFSRSHKDADLWIGPGGSASVEGISVEKWHKLVEENE